MTKTEKARKAMIDSQLYTNNVQDKRTLAALESIPREQFVPEILQGVAYADEDLNLGNGRFMLEPLVFARLLQAADIQPTDKVMDIACATGYSSAVLSQLASEVVAIESDKNFAAKAEENLKNLGVNNVKLHVAELLLGANKTKQFDVIFIGARIEQLPDIINSQLKDNGRIVTILDDDESPEGPANIVVVTKAGKIASIRKIAQANAPKLSEFNRKRDFIF